MRKTYEKTKALSYTLGRSDKDPYALLDSLVKKATRVQRPIIIRRHDGLEVAKVGINEDKTYYITLKPFFYFWLVHYRDKQESGYRKDAKVSYAKGLENGKPETPGNNRAKAIRDYRLYLTRTSGMDRFTGNTPRLWHCKSCDWWFARPDQHVIRCPKCKSDYIEPVKFRIGGK